MRTFYQLAINSFLAGLTTMLIWLALSLWIYTNTQSVLATSIMSGIYLVATAATSIWFGTLVDHHKKKTVMLASSVVTLIAFACAFAFYQLAPSETFSSHASPGLWVLVVLIFTGVIVGNVRAIAMPTVVGLMVAEKQRDKANGIVGTLGGIVFMLSSIISGFLLAASGMFWIFLMCIGLLILSILHLSFIRITEKKTATLPAKKDNKEKRGVLKTISTISGIPGLLALILFTSFNNFLGGVFMPLLDPYGLSLVSLEVWGVIWGFLSLGFIIGGLFIAKNGLGKNPLKTLLLVNAVLWIDCILFTIQPSIVLLIIGMFIYLCLVPFVEAAEHTVIQKIVPPQRQGRVFGFAHSIESSASPLTAFAIGPIAQFLFIPFMTTGWGVEHLGSWFGTGPGRGIALLFMTAGILGLITTLFAFRTKAYRLLTKRFLQ